MYTAYQLYTAIALDTLLYKLYITRYSTQHHIMYTAYQLYNTVALDVIPATLLYITIPAIR